MKYTFESERDAIMNDPTLADFRQNVLSKPDGRDMLTAYIEERVQRKNQEAWFDGVDKSNPRYGDFKDMVNKRRKAESEVEETLGSPPTVLQKVVNAKSVIQTDWWDKTLDVVGRLLSNPKEESQQQESQKPSLWDVFWK